MSGGKRQPARSKRDTRADAPTRGAKASPPPRSSGKGAGGRAAGSKVVPGKGGTSSRSTSSRSSSGQVRGTSGLPVRGRGNGPPRQTTSAGSSRAQNLDGRQVEGRQAVRELLLAGGRRVVDVWIAEDIEHSAVIGDITELAGEMRVPVRRVTRGALEAEARSDAPQGVLAHAAPIEPVELDTLCTRPALSGAAPFLLALDGVTDPQNLGSLLRSGSCAGITGVVLPRHRAAHITPTVTKASAGAVEHLPMALVSGLPAAMMRAKELGVWTVGLDADGEVGLFDLELGNEPVMLVLGAEGKGLSRLTRTRCDIVVSIPLWGPLSSLNVGVAGAMACYEVARHRGQSSIRSD